MKKNLFPADEPLIVAAPDARHGGGLPGNEAARATGATDDGDLLRLSAGTVTTAVTNAAKPVASIATLAGYLVNGYWQYEGTVAHRFAGNTVTYNISGLNTAEQFLAQSALQAWSEVANITFVQTAGAAGITFSHNGTMQAYTSGYWSGSTISSQIVNISTDWVTTDGGANDGKTGIDSYAYQTYVHEIGHALGLGHQGPYNGSASYSTNAIFANDTWQYSIMSYFSEQNYSGSSYRYVVTPQMADIYAIGLIYGAATTTRTGDTVYGFNSNAGAVFNFSNYTSAPALTIYDSGGSDTLDCSAYSAAQIIDLRAGTFSSVGGLVNNIGIAMGAAIEKAIGGSGNDRLIANDAGCMLLGGSGADTLFGGAGADKLVGGVGVDILTGGGGADTFLFAVGQSSAVSGERDRITDFVSGADLIDLSGYDAVSSTGGYDQFRFIGTVGFHGSAGELNYVYNGTTGITTLQGDTNGDGLADFGIDFTGNVIIGAADLIGIAIGPIVVDAFGATSLMEVGSQYFLTSSSSTGPTLKYGGSAVTPGQFGNWTLLGAEQTANGYEVAWKFAGSNQYCIWNTDSNGNYTSGFALPGTSVDLMLLEPSFQQDLNGDGVVGPVARMIEASGTTSLMEVGKQYYLTSSSGTGPTLKHGGSAVAPGQFGDWTLLGAEQTANGYEVAWKFAGSNQYSIWNTDTNGNYTSGFAASGTSVDLMSLEPSFHQDLNGDGAVGLFPKIIEAFGVTSLMEVGSQYFLTSSSGTGPTLKYGGSAVTPGQFGNWTLLGAEQTANGYEVAWKFAGSNQYCIWNTDSNGNYTSGFALPGTNVDLMLLEPSFQQDLNGDGVVGPVARMIEASGTTSLMEVGKQYYLTSSSGTGPTLKHGGSAVAPGQFGDWTLLGAEQTANGYEVAWKFAGSNQYSIWNTDTNGNYTSGFAASGTSVDLMSLEPSFHQDLNGDGVVGLEFQRSFVSAHLPDWVL